MSPKQEKVVAAILQFVHRTATKIADLPKEQRGATLEAARAAVIESATRHGITDPQFLSLCTDGVEVVLREIETSGNASWPNELSVRRLIDLAVKAKAK
jgi:hypothetical protein